MKNTAIIEIPKNSYYKYELDKETKRLKLDRVLGIPCPYNYGFLNSPDLPLSADGDPLDIFIVSALPIEPLVEVKFTPWSILLCEDNGVEDNKVIAYLEGDNHRDYDYFRNIRFYLENYKQGFKILDVVILNNTDKTLENFIKSK